ncbi:Rv0361 family membrane protein [Gordonia liuliyuniae]|uniref:DUF4878 domain-containing protein n=1 Tax=Gordonia liuliyuniae TaxID=2911517 RepID=A0ABS9IPR9_9ACTN|nr:hypothetical protein [Gordonia liuliyuniae]MCF8587556.1 hypothetical protein [Gordonia liuliyuniae]
MSAKRPDGTAQDDLPDSAPEHRSWRAALPFIIAFVLIIIVVAWIALSHLIRPSEERVSEDTKVQYVVNDMYSARNSLNYDLYRDSQCTANINAKGFPTAAEFADTNRGPLEKDGKLVVPEMEVEVTGSRAAVTVHVHRENTEDKKTTTDLIVVKQGDDWKVCAS